MRYAPCRAALQKSKKISYIILGVDSMNQKTFEKILNTWKEHEYQSIAKMPTEKSAACLSFAQFEAGEFSSEQQEHIHQCNYCSRMNRLFDKYRRQQDAVSIAVDEKATRAKQELLWEKLKENLSGFINGLGNFVAPIPKPIRLAIPIVIAALIMIFIIQTPEAKYAALARIEPLYYQSIESRGEESLSENERLFQQGMAFYQQGKYGPAINKLLLVIKKQPEDVNVNFYVGLCYLLIKNPDRAIFYLQKVIELNGEFLFEKCYWYLGNAYLLKNDRKKALKMFEKVVAMEGDYEWEAKEMIERIEKIVN
jgi:tetratricopeptide (TPR) repeat protein